MAYEFPNAQFGSLFLQFMDTVGDSTGAINMNVDGSVTPVVYKTRCPTGFQFNLMSVGIYIQGAGNIRAEGYGTLVSPLTNGTTIDIAHVSRTPPAILPVTDQLPIRTNSGWLAYTFETSTQTFAAGESVLSLIYNLDQAGRGITFGPGDEFRVTVNDDLTGLTRHYVRLSFMLNRIQ